VNTRFLFVALALVLGCLAESVNAKAEGAYQRTADNKTMVWNSFPQRGETMSWSGKQDKEDYATGHGELTFHKKTGFTFARHDVVTERYSGKMVHGKFEGTVETVNDQAEARHATFVAGKRTGDWEAGPTPKTSEKTTPKSAAQPPAEGPTENVQPPAAGDGLRREERSTSSGQHSTEKPSAETTESPSHESLRSLAAPPASLQTPGAPDASAPRSRLTTPEVIGLADSAARANGYDLGKYQNPQSKYNAAADMWSVSYEKKSGGDEGAKRFSVRIDDKSERTTIVTSN
jgi:hypothetical protein